MTSEFINLFCSSLRKNDTLHVLVQVFYDFILRKFQHKYIHFTRNFSSIFGYSFQLTQPCVLSIPR